MCYPFEVLTTLEHDYPATWDKVDQLTAEGFRLWSPRCFLPSYFWREVFSEQTGPDEEMPELLWNLETLRWAAIGTWRYGKNIYRFHPRLEQALLTSELDCSLPFNSSIRLPEYCLYLETRHLQWYGKPVRGVWVSLDVDFETQQLVLRFIIEMKNGCSLAEMQVGDWNLREGVTRLLEGSNHTQEQIDGMIVMLKPLMSLLLYVCCDGRHDVVSADLCDANLRDELSYVRNVGGVTGARLQRGRSRTDHHLPFVGSGTETGCWHGEWVRVDNRKRFVCYWETGDRRRETEGR